MLQHLIVSGLAGWYGATGCQDQLQLLGTQHTAEDHQSENAARSQPQPGGRRWVAPRDAKKVLKILPKIGGETES